MMSVTPNENDMLQQQLQLSSLQQQQMSAVGGAVATTTQHGAHDIRPIKNVKVPEGTYTMSPSDYCTYRKDVLAYQILTQYSDRQIVLQMCHMDIDLKRSIDTNFGNQWDAFNVDDALDAIKTVVLLTSNVAVYRKEFDNTVQRDGETVREFVIRLKTCASDCSFICPFDDSHDLTDYHLINRLRSGICQETLQKQDILTTVSSIITYCEAYESAVKDKEKLSRSTNFSDPHLSINSSSFTQQFDITNDELVSAISLYRKKKCSKASSHKCKNCGYNHIESAVCPASSKACLNCGLTGHFAGVCTGTSSCANCGKQGHRTNACRNAKMMSGVIIAALHRTHALKTTLPTISIEIRNCRLLAVPDTGAQVTVAGISYLQKCGLKESQMNKPPHSLKHVGGGFLVVVGSHILSIKHKKTVIDELVYFSFPHCM